MDADEPRLSRDDVITPGGDLTVLGVDQLKEREAVLQSELERTRAMIKSKRDGLAAADSLFKS